MCVGRRIELREELLPHNDVGPALICVTTVGLG